MTDLLRYYDLEENAAQLLAAVRDCDERLRALMSELKYVDGEIAERERRGERSMRTRPIQMAPGAKGLGGWEDVEDEASPLGALRKQKSEIEAKISRLRTAAGNVRAEATSASQLVSNLRQHLRDSGVKL